MHYSDRIYSYDDKTESFVLNKLSDEGKKDDLLKCKEGLKKTLKEIYGDMDMQMVYSTESYKKVIFNNTIINKYTKGHTMLTILCKLHILYKYIATSICRNYF